MNLNPPIDMLCSPLDYAVHFCSVRESEYGTAHNHCSLHGAKDEFLLIQCNWSMSITLMLFSTQVEMPGLEILTLFYIGRQIDWQQ